MRQNIYQSHGPGGDVGRAGGRGPDEPPGGDTL